MSSCCRFGELNDCVLEGLTSSILVGPLTISNAKDDIVVCPPFWFVQDFRAPVFEPWFSASMASGDLSILFPKCGPGCGGSGLGVGGGSSLPKLLLSAPPTLMTG